MAKRPKYNKSRRSLFCYGCAWSDDDGGFPGQPGTYGCDAPCWFCMRNPAVNNLIEIGEPLPLTKWPDGTDPVALPMDCYCTQDMSDQTVQWIEQAVEEATQAQVKAQLDELRREYGLKGK